MEAAAGAIEELLKQKPGTDETPEEGEKSPVATAKPDTDTKEKAKN